MSRVAVPLVAIMHVKMFLSMVVILSDLFNLLGKFSSNLLGDRSLCLVDSWLTWWEVKFARSLPNRSGLPGTK